MTSLPLGFNTCHSVSSAIHRHLTLTTTPHQYLSFWRHMTLKPSNSPSPVSHHYPHQYLSFWRHIHLNLAIHRHLTLTTTPHQYLSFWRHIHLNLQFTVRFSPLPPSIPVILKTHTLKPVQFTVTSVGWHQYLLGLSVCHRLQNDRYWWGSLVRVRWRWIARFKCMCLQNDRYWCG